MSKNYKRRNFFIKKDFQGKLILGYFLFVLGGCILFGLILAIVSADSLTVAYQNHDLQLGQTPSMLAKNMLIALWVFMLLGGSIVIVFALFITHRMAGPVFRLERALDNMTKGNLNDTIYLRKKDDGKALAAKINGFNRQLSEQLRTINTHSQAIEELIHTHATEGATEEAKTAIPPKILQQIKVHNQAIHKIMHAFTLADE